MWLVSADTCGGGTHDEAISVSAWEAITYGAKLVNSDGTFGNQEAMITCS